MRENTHTNKWIKHKNTHIQVCEGYTLKGEVALRFAGQSSQSMNSRFSSKLCFKIKAESHWGRHSTSTFGLHTSAHVHTRQPQYSYFVFWDRASWSSGWPQTPYVAEDDFELSHFLSTKIRGCTTIPRKPLFIIAKTLKQPRSFHRLVGKQTFIPGQQEESMDKVHV